MELHEQIVSFYDTFCEGGELEKSYRMNIVNFLQHWIKNHYRHDFEHNTELTEATRAFVQDKVTPMEGETVAKVLMQGFQRTRSQSVIKRNQRMSVKARRLLGQSRNESESLQFAEAAPALVVLKGPIKSFLDIPPLEIARQLTIVEHDLFCQIQPKECLNCCWSGKRQKELAPNILNMIEHFNQVSKRPQRP